MHRCPVRHPIRRHLHLSGTAPARTPPMAIRMVTMKQRMQDLIEIMPNCVFRNRPARARGLLDDGGEVAAAAVFHEDVENAGVAVDEAVVIAHDVRMVEVLEDVSAVMEERVSQMERGMFERWTHTSATICFLSRSLMRSKLSSFLANTYPKPSEILDTDESEKNRTDQSIAFPPDLADDAKGAIANDIEGFVCAQKGGGWSGSGGHYEGGGGMKERSKNGKMIATARHDQRG
jgi:hypothetical protein